MPKRPPRLRILIRQRAPIGVVMIAVAAALCGLILHEIGALPGSQPAGDHDVDAMAFSVWQSVVLPGVPALLVGGFGLWLVRRSWRQCNAMVRAGERGPRHTATIIGHVPANKYVRDIEIKWRVLWREHTGAETQSVFMHRRPDLERDAPEGREITIHTDPVTGHTFWDQDIFAP